MLLSLWRTIRVLWVRYYMLVRACMVAYYRRLSQRIALNPKMFILIPSSLAFILAYPTLYDLYMSPIDLAVSNQITSFVTVHTSSLQPYLNHPTDMASKQLWIQSKTNVLDKDFLVAALCLQNQLTAGITFTPNDINDTAYLLTPFSIWNNSATALANDNIPLKSINFQKSYRSDVYLAGVTKVNSIMKQAQALHICLVYRGEAGRIWERNLQNVRASDTHFVFLKPESESSVFSLHLSQMLSVPEKLLLWAFYASFLVWFLTSLSNLHTIKSRLGLLNAFGTEILLAVLCTITITKWVLRHLDTGTASLLFSSNYDQTVPVSMLVILVLWVGAENMFRLVGYSCSLPEELPVHTILAKAMGRSCVNSSFTVAALVTMFFTVYGCLSFSGPFANVKQYCVFLVVGLLVDHFLHLTFFTAVLSVDIRRIDLDYLLKNDGNSSTSLSRRPKNGGFAALLMGSYSTNKPSRSSPRHILGQYLLKVRAPLAGHVPQSMLMFGCAFAVISKWIRDSGSDGADTGSLVGPFADATKRRALCFYLVNLLKTKLTRPITIRLDSPVVALTDGLDFSYTLESSSRFDAWHRLEFLLSLVFVVAINALVLKVKVNKESSGYMGGSLTKDNTLEMTDSPGDEPFSEKRLVGGHYLDILKISTSSGSPFVVTIGLDHKVMVWSPIADPIPSPFPLPIQSQVWPVVHVVLGNQGNTIALFSKSGLVSCYSRSAQRFIWQVVLEGLKGSVPLESFFRRKTIPAFLQRKMLLEKQKKSQLESEERERSQLHRTTSDQSFSGASIRAERSEEGKDLELMELTVMAKNGAMYTISCDDGKVSEENITSSKALVSARRLTSARVSDRLICQVSNGIIMVATSVNNKWKFRKLLVQEEKYNKGQSLLTPAAMSRHSSVGSKYRPFHVTGSQTSLSTLTPVEPPSHNLTTSTIAIVSFVGMIVRTRDLVAELIDVQTGTLVRKFNIGQFVKNSFRVFHSEPQHCRFCGCASVRSFSLVYTELDTNTVIMHTFSIENRAKNNICWRVERDPRETRCLGFDSVTEQQHWLEGSECWNLTDMNMIVGIVKRKQAAMAVKSETHSSALRSSELRSRRAKPKDSQPVQISDTWEGFTMTATGKVTYHEIPCVPGLSSNPSLLVKRINQIERFGHKSVVVGFGNIIKILYLGNNDELLEKDDYDTNSPNTRLEGNIRGLSFVNKRRQNGLHNGKAEVSVNFSRSRE